MNIFQKYIQKDKLGIFIKRFLFLILLSVFTFFFFSKIHNTDILAANVLSNPSFTGGTSNWTLTTLSGSTAIVYDSAVYQDSAGSVRGQATGRRTAATGEAVQTISTSITAGSIVNLSFYWSKQCVAVNCRVNTISVDIAYNGGSYSTVWTDTSMPAYGARTSWASASQDVSSYFSSTGTYQIRLYTRMDTGNNASAAAYGWFDNLNLDVTPPNITVGTTGTQVSSTYANTSNLYIGGAFTFVRNTGSTSVTSITISETGTISDSNISGLILYYKQEATCSTSFPTGTTQFNSTPGTFSSGSSTVTGTMTVGTSQICMYAEVDVGSASGSDTIEIQITDPSTQVTASVGTVSPASAVAISGTTTVASNTAPNFTDYSNNGPVNPGSTVTFSTVASDPDGQNITLVVCKTQGVTGTACDGGAGDTWCTSSAAASNPSCGYSVPSVYPDNAYDTYPYIFDSMGLGSGSALQGTLETFTVNNVTPTVSAVTINGGAAITLVSATTKAVTLTATVSDNNSCYGTEISSVLGYTYRSGVGYTGCDTSGEANNNYCYPEVSCSVVGGTCTDNTDASANYTCTVNIYYYADPTGTDTQYPSDTWMDTIKATDDDSASNALQVSVGVQMNMLEAMSITSSINYGTLSVQTGNDPLDRTTTSTPTGNVGLDHEIYGTDMCTDYPTCTASKILVGNQKYALSASTPYASATALSTSPTPVYIDISKPINGTPTAKNMWWGMYAPLNTSPGAYTGTINVTAVASDPLNW